MTKSLFCIFTIYNTVVIIHIHAEFYRSIWFSVAQEAHGLNMNALAELIHCTGVGHLISRLIKCREVSHKTCNLAGNVYDLVYAVSQDLDECVL